MKKILALASGFTLATSIAVALLARPSYARNQPEQDLKTAGEPGELELVARFDFTNPLSMVASGDLVFVGMQINQGYQVAILDATDPAHPVEVAEIDLWENEIRPLGVIGEMLYQTLSSPCSIIGSEIGYHLVGHPF